MFAALVGSSRISHALVKEDLSLNEHPGPAEVISHPDVAVKKKKKCLAKMPLMSTESYLEASYISVLSLSLVVCV